MKRTMLVAVLGLLGASSVLAQEAQPAATAQSTAPDQSAPTATTPTADTSEPRPRRAITDRIDLDTTIVTGNRELPKVLYIVPWKKAELGELPAQPFNTLLDEVLTPVDRDVFRREVTYYGALSGGDEAKPAGEKTTSEPSRAQ